MPGASVMETRKSAGIAALAAAAVTLARLARTKTPAAFRTAPYGSRFWIA